MLVIGYRACSSCAAVCYSSWVINFHLAKIGAVLPAGLSAVLHECEIVQHLRKFYLTSQDLSFY